MPSHFLLFMAHEHSAHRGCPLGSQLAAHFLIVAITMTRVCVCK